MAKPYTDEELAEIHRDGTEHWDLADIARLIATVDAERARADRNAELIGKHDPTGEDHLHELMDVAAERDVWRARAERAEAALRDAWNTGDVRTLNNHAHASVLRAALDAPTDTPATGPDLCVACGERPEDDGTGVCAECWDDNENAGATGPCPTCGGTGIVLGPWLGRRRSLGPCPDCTGQPTHQEET